MEDFRNSVYVAYFSFISDSWIDNLFVIVWFQFITGCIANLRSQVEDNEKKVG